MRETRSSGSVEGVMGNHDSYSDSRQGVRCNAEEIKRNLFEICSPQLVAATGSHSLQAALQM